MIWKTQFAIVYMIGDLVFCDVQYKVDAVHSSVMLISHTTKIVNSGTELVMAAHEQIAVHLYCWLRWWWFSVCLPLPVHPGSDVNSMDSVDSGCTMGAGESQSNQAASSSSELIIWEIEVPKVSQGDWHKKLNHKSFQL